MSESTQNNSQINNLKRRKVILQKRLSEIRQYALSCMQGVRISDIQRVQFKHILYLCNDKYQDKGSLSEETTQASLEEATACVCGQHSEVIKHIKTLKITTDSEEEGFFARFQFFDWGNCPFSKGVEAYIEEIMRFFDYHHYSICGIDKKEWIYIHFYKTEEIKEK